MVDSTVSSIVSHLFNQF